MIEPTDAMVEAVRAATGCHTQACSSCTAKARTAAAALLAIVYCPNPHLYLSTGCLHDTDDGHAYCRIEARRYDGSTKTAATCKFCGTPCSCGCHTAATQADTDGHTAEMQDGTR